MPDVLIVEDDAQIRKFLRISLEANGFTVREARLGQDGLQRCAERAADVIVLDLGLPDIDGLDVICRLREWSGVPVIVLSVRCSDAEKVAALDAGANDYVTKPFSITELMARVRVAVRKPRTPREEPALFRCGGLEVDFSKRRVCLDGTEVHLSRKEYDLLRLLVGHSGEVLTHQNILREIWGPAHTGDVHYLRVLVGHLRERLGDDPTKPHYIHTVQGVGYRFAAP